MKLRTTAHRKLIVVLAALVLGAAGYFIYYAIALHQNKTDFQKARSTIDIVYADITKKVGEPDNFKRDSYCEPASSGFTGYGTSTCTVGTSFIYGVSDEVAANKLFKKIQGIISTHQNILPPTRPLAKKITDQFVVSSTYHSTSDRYKIGGLQCVANYMYDTPLEVDLKIKDKLKKKFETSIDCYGDARKLYFNSKP